MKKLCSKCGQYLPATPKYFYKDKRRKDGLANPCRYCKKGYELTERAKLLDRQRHLKYEYKLTFLEFVKLSNKQNDCCVVCGVHYSQLSRGFDVDHDHKTGKVRGLLCNYRNKIVERHINNPEHFKNPLIRKVIEDYLRMI
jgi:hypothetical protein